MWCLLFDLCLGNFTKSFVVPALRFSSRVRHSKFIVPSSIIAASVCMTCFLSLQFAKYKSLYQLLQLFYGFSLSFWSSNLILLQTSIKNVVYCRISLDLNRTFTTCFLIQQSQFIFDENSFHVKKPQLYKTIFLYSDSKIYTNYS